MTKAAARVTLAVAFSFYRCSSSHVIPALACAKAWDLWLRLAFTFLLLSSLRVIARHEAIHL